MKPGDMLGPYRVLDVLGVGGMGEVYKARDTRLNRPVAIKVLPAAASADIERRARFEREAQAIAALNHPNIVTIHAVEEADGVPFFTMEYVDGKTLAQMIPPHGLPLEEFLRIAIPLADALSTAHECGTLHRDLKPANVMVTTDGRVKVLDFGLAKLNEAVMQADGGAQTAAGSTGEGRIVGTVAYMSPEQAEGRALDQRSDVFSLGILLYEMATGQRPFKGDTSVSVITAILRDTPGSVTDVRPDLPRDLGRMLRRALTKDPEHRYQSAKDLRNDLESLKEDLDSGQLVRAVAPPPAVGLFARHPRLAAGAFVAVIVLVAAGGWWGSRLIAPTQPAPPAARAFEDFRMTPLTAGETAEGALAVSPDGRYVAYAFVAGGREGLSIRQVETSATAQLVSPGDVQYRGVTFTPNGDRLFYVAYPRGSGQATLYEVTALGGTPRRLIHDVDCAVAFSPDGARFAFVRGIPGKGSAILTANADGTGERTLATRQTPNHFVLAAPSWSPDGGVIAAAAYDGSPLTTMIVSLDAATGAVTPVGAKRWNAVDSLAWAPVGRVLIVAAADRGVADTTQIWEVTVPDGSTRRITKDIGAYSRVSRTADGHTLVALRSEWRGTLWVAPAEMPDRANRIASVPDTVGSYPVRWTVDGRILYTATESGNRDVCAVRPDGTDLRQLTTSPGVDAGARASPDNRHIVFLSDRDGRVRVWRMEPDGSRQSPLTNGPFDLYPVVAADSRSVYYVRGNEPDRPMYTVPIEGGEPTLLSGPLSLTPSGSWAGVPSWFLPESLSPDGRLIAGGYFDNRESRSGIALVPEGGRGVVRTLDVPLPLPRIFEQVFAWAPDGRAMTFVSTTDGMANLWRQPLDDGPVAQLTHYTSGEDIVTHAWSRDGKWLAFVRGSAESHVVLLRDVGRGR